jgi:galactose mutarotase-like enzyme
MSRARIVETEVDGFAAHTLVAPGGTLEATFVVGAGMVGASLRHAGAELLDARGGVAQYARTGSTMGIPLLHPWANRLAGLRYAVGTRAVVLDPAGGALHLDGAGLPIHGLVPGRSRFAVVATDVDARRARLATRLDFSSDPALLAAFPFPHRLDLAVSLDDAGLTVETGLAATGDAPVPVAFGFHPYLRLPDAPRSSWHLDLPVRERLVLDAGLLPTGAREPVAIPAGPLGDRHFDDLFVAPARASVAGGGRRIGVVFEGGYPFAQVYAPAGASFICIEPMTAPGNALVRGGPELRLVPPGARFAACFSILVCRV